MKGDRIQIATVPLAAANNAVKVTLDAILGHTICALLAVLGGSLIARKVSERAVTMDDWWHTVHRLWGCRNCRGA